MLPSWRCSGLPQRAGSRRADPGAGDRGAWWTASWPGRPPTRPCAVTRRLADAGLLVTHRPPRRGHHRAGAGRAGRDEYVELLARLRDAGLAGVAEVSVKLSALGQAAGRRRPRRSRWRTPQLICWAAREAGTTVTLDMEDHTTTDATLAILAELRQDFPEDRRGAAGLPAPDRGRLP